MLQLHQGKLAEWRLNNSNW